MTHGGLSGEQGVTRKTIETISVRHPYRALCTSFCVLRVPHSPYPLCVHACAQRIKSVPMAPNPATLTRADRIFQALLWSDPAASVRSLVERGRTGGCRCAAGPGSPSPSPLALLPHVACDAQHAGTRFNVGRNCAVTFGSDVTREFLSDNRLQLLIRSHEVVPRGYQVRLATLPSPPPLPPSVCDRVCVS